jgi:SAM-dependent methyltransferase
MTDRAQFIRDRMRATWGVRTRSYTAHVDNHAAHTRHLIVAAQPQAGERVLDVATGPGVVAVAAAAVVGPTGQVLATDLAPEWAEVVAERCAAAGLDNVTFQAMGAEQLELADGSFDLVLCQFGLMFVPDPVQALREMRRVLRDGGRVGVSVWSTLDRVKHETAQRFLAPYQPQLPPEQQLPGPVSLGEPGLIEGYVAEAGFQDVTVQRHTFAIVYPNRQTYWQARTEGAHLRAALDALTPEQRQQLERDVLSELEQYRQGEALHLPSEAIYVTAVR